MRSPLLDPSRCLPKVCLTLRYPFMIKHNEMVKALAKDGAVIARELTPLDAHLWHMSSALQGEAGELFDAIKKGVIYRKDLDLENVIEELGDIEFYLEGLRQGLNLSRAQCIEANIAKLGKRYVGLKYSDGAAQSRTDKTKANPVAPQVGAARPGDGGKPSSDTPFNPLDHEQCK